MEDSDRRPDSEPRPSPPSDTTAVLLARVRAGDARARNLLISRYLPALKRWAHGRLPTYARDIRDTGDLVQDTVIRALSHLDSFEPRREGSFLVYLRRSVRNQIVDEIRRARRRPGRDPLPQDLVDRTPSPLEEVIGREALERYEAALARLTENQQEAVMMRVEMGFTYPEIALALGRPSANAARMLVARALVRLAEAMDERE